MLTDACLDTDALVLLWLFEVFESATAGHEVIEGIFSIYPNFYRITFFLNFFLFFG